MPDSTLLDPSALLSVLPTLLPARADDSTAPALANAHDGLVALLHTLLSRLDFRLLGLASPASPPPTSNVLPDAWNAHDGSYALSYAHPASALRFVLRAVVVGPRLSIVASALEGQSASAHVELDVARYTSQAFWPYPRADAAQQEPLVHGFVSSSRVQDLTRELQLHIVQRLVPGLHKVGYEELATPASSSAPSSSSQPAPVQPRAPSNDPYLPGATGGPLGPLPPRGSPFAVGERDRGFGPPPLFPGGTGGLPPLGGDDGGGMIVGPNHPMWRERFGPQHPGGGDGFNPYGGPVPPGARFDPVGPGGLGGFGAPGAGGPSNGRGPRPRGGPGGDPDWDDVRPPRGNNGYDDMFM